MGYYRSRKSRECGNWHKGQSLANVNRFKREDLNLFRYYTRNAKKVPLKRF